MRLVITFFLFLIISPLLPQNGNGHVGTGIRGSYVAAIAYPGFKLGVEKPYKVKRTERSRGENIHYSFRERYIVLNLGMYHHKTFHTNYFLMAEWQMRIQRSGGFFIEFSPGLGASRTFLAGPAYKVDNAGNVTKVPYAGYYYAAATFGGGPGYNFYMKGKQRPFKLFFRSNILILYPYNKFIYPRHSVELGLIYTK